ncbi:uncharacterized protein LOC120152719 [Hibiscus syriacus]|uniref:uncharacterized protein LOC120152719 n=1 Tax=Hibiscus syriacus TaxID=106335 RepID=UPI0019219CC8|nr:uncharacterized protein LOC120152719 [Hibiscus syriacus]
MAKEPKPSLLILKKKLKEHKNTPYTLNTEPKNDMQASNLYTAPLTVTKTTAPLTVTKTTGGTSHTNLNAAQGESSTTFHRQGRSIVLCHRSSSFDIASDGRSMLDLYGRSVLMPGTWIRSQFYEKLLSTRRKYQRLFDSLLL